MLPAAARVTARFERALDWTVGLAVLVTVTVTAVQVAARYLFNSSIPWVQELTRFVFVWMIMLGSGLAALRGSHIAFSLLADALHARAARVVRGVVTVAMCVFLVAITIAGTQLAMQNTRQRSPVLQMPMAVVYASLPVAGILGIAGCIIAFLRDGGRARRGAAAAGEGAS